MISHAGKGSGPSPNKWPVPFPFSLGRRCPPTGGRMRQGLGWFWPLSFERQPFRHREE